MAAKYITHTVSDGDTIQSIGQRYEVDWTKIVELNSLSYPYVIGEIETPEEYADIDTVAKFGSVLLIPTDGLRFPLKTNNSAAEVAKYSLGCDLDLFTFEKGEHFNVVNLEIEGQLTDDNQGDLRLAEGIENLKQQLIVRLGTERGALLLHPEFGTNIKKYIGMRTTPELLTKIKLEIQEALLGDFRVKDVNKIQVAFNNRQVHVECVVTPIPPATDFLLSTTYFGDE